MGGLGSGRRLSSRPTVEGALRLDVLGWKRDGLLHPGKAWRSWWKNSIGEKLAEIECVAGSDSVRLRYQANGEPADYLAPVERASCNYGGTRPWLRCPNTRCRRRCRFLYASGWYFVCRICAGLTYASCQASRNPSKLARLYGVSALDALGEWDRSLIAQLYRRLDRSSNPRKIEALRRRIKRLEALQGADMDYLTRLVSRLGR
jgi:hypothetical protein